MNNFCCEKEPPFLGLELHYSLMSLSTTPISTEYFSNMFDEIYDRLFVNSINCLSDNIVATFCLQVYQFLASRFLAKCPHDVRLL